MRKKGPKQFHNLVPVSLEFHFPGAIFVDAAGLLPEDNRATFWLDVHALYRVHNQTITLFFERIESDVVSNDIISQTAQTSLKSQIVSCGGRRMSRTKMLLQIKCPHRYVASPQVRPFCVRGFGSVLQKALHATHVCVNVGSIVCVCWQFACGRSR